ncbi:hypothetical protein C8A01DRAFT_43165 [Parachaetomium inaequale]|uniref:BZIP domain-containing protein n=1 Tax=Parachaetomium inaequale TaxID=2588326 RepID=A0AAN6SVW2_9PEZI|nr:hypothetical protein C8A01DRAFT_43165 [Parachaetomium inaequale]
MLGPKSPVAAALSAYRSQWEKAAMSQGDSAPRPRSRAHQDDPRSQPLRDPSGFAPNQGDGTSQQGGHRASDSRGILNPAGPYGTRAEQSPSLAQPLATGGAAQPVMGAGQYGTEGSPSRHYVYQAPGVTTPRSTNQTIPSTTSPGDPPTSADRGSPQAVHPYPMAARRILTPKSPRTASLSRAAMRTVEAQHLATSLPAPISRSHILGHDAQIHGSGPSPLGPSPQLRNCVPGQGPEVPAPARPTSGLARSLSHPSLRHGIPPAPPAEQPQPGSLKREHSGRPVLSGPPFAAPLPASQPFGGSGMLGDSRWGPGILSSMPAGARNLSMTEGQPVLAITPRHGEEILVAVDVLQGSRQADQKRQRNAGASARFRQRKKEREREQQEELQKLENENRELERRNEELARRCQDLEAELEVYRNGRARPRDAISQMPGGNEWADREPPSPISRTAGGPSAPDSSALLAHQPPPLPPHNHSQAQHHPAPFYQPLAHPLAHAHPRSGSYGDSSALEPPARRRRTDSEPQLPTTSYSLMTPTTLPPITGPAPPHPSFGMPPSPHVTPPLGTARLPPLRFDQARTPSTTPPPVPTAPPPPAMPSQSGSPYVTTRRLPYETGWATDPRPETDGGPR